MLVAVVFVCPTETLVAYESRLRASSPLLTKVGSLLSSPVNGPVNIFYIPSYLFIARDTALADLHNVV